MEDEKVIVELRAMSEEIDELYRRGKREAGASLLEQALRKAHDVDAAYHLFFEGERLGYAQQDFSAQEAVFRQAVELRPLDWFLLRNLGVSLSNLDREEDALQLFDQVLALKPADYHALRNKGVALSKLDRNEEAIQLFDQALALKSDDYNILRNKGVSLSNLGQDAEAIKLFDQVLKLKPDDYITLHSKGAALGKLGRYEDAHQFFDHALTLKPEAHDTLRCKGVTFSRLGNNEKAWEFNERALALEPDDVAAQVNKAYLLHQRGHASEARKYIADVVRRHPKDQYALRIQKHLRFLGGQGETPPASGGDPALERQSLQKVVRSIRVTFKDEADRIKRDILGAKEELNDFLKPETRFYSNKAQFLILRKWNSYTPSIPRDDERSIGGGYYFRVNGVGTIVDPGFNFLENFNRVGGRIADIHNIVITHAHNDHTADLESILSLVYKHNDEEKQHNPEKPRLLEVRLFMNVGSDRKFSGFIDLRGSEHIETVTVLTPGHQYDMGQNLWLSVLPAYHDEVIGKKYAVGLHFELRETEGDPTRVVITSDTGLFPKKDRKADTSAKEIWELYGLKDKDIHLLVPHLGSVKESEFDADIDSKPEEVYYPNHLGLIGTIRVISALEPELAIVSEFGEELKNFQGPLVEMIAACVHQYEPTKGWRPVVLPGDITFIYDLRARGVCCMACQKPVRPSLELIAHKEKDCFYYYDKSRKNRLDEVSGLVRRFEEALKERRLLFLHAEKKSGKAD
ncbi:tetratricopeptide repeat protein [Humidesulfovibrio sp.]